MVRILIELGPDRDRLGALSALDVSGKTVLGPFPVAARASDALANRQGNPRRDPLFPYGDTPTGSYVIRQLMRSGNRTAFPVAQFGPYGVIVLEGISGDAALAEANGRFHVLIEGGKPANADTLAATAGALRLRNEHQRALMALLRKAACTTVDVLAEPRVGQTGRVHDDGTCREPDPPSASADTRRVLPHLSRREAMRTGGAVAFGISASFAALGAIPAFAGVELAYNVPSPEPIPHPPAGSGGPNGSPGSGGGV